MADVQLQSLRREIYTRSRQTSGRLWSRAAHRIGGCADPKRVFTVADPDASTFNEATKSGAVEIIQRFGGMLNVHKLYGQIHQPGMHDR